MSDRLKRLTVKGSNIVTVETRPVERHRNQQSIQTGQRRFQRTVLPAFHGMVDEPWIIAMQVSEEYQDLFAKAPDLLDQNGRLKAEVERLRAEKAELVEALKPFAEVPAANIVKDMFRDNVPVEIEFDWDEKQWRVWAAISADANAGCENIPKVLDYDRARMLIAKAKEGDHE